MSVMLFLPDGRALATEILPMPYLYPPDTYAYGLQTDRWYCNSFTTFLKLEWKPAGEASIPKAYRTTALLFT